MRPNMCVPQARQACRWIVAEASITRSLSPFSRTVTFSRGTTATTEKIAPSGFQHLVQQIESLVDLPQLENMGDHRIDLDLAVHVPVDDLRHVGTAARAAERRALPDPAGNQLEWPG